MGPPSDVHEPSEGSVPTKAASAHSTSIQADLDDNMDEGRWQQAASAERAHHFGRTRICGRQRSAADESRATPPPGHTHTHTRVQVFGVLYTVSKEKRVSPLFVAVRLLLDVLQLWLLIVTPQNGFLVRSDWIIWRIVSFIGATHDDLGTGDARRPQQGSNTSAPHRWCVCTPKLQG